jgi:hypothetical protein
LTVGGVRRKDGATREPIVADESSEPRQDTPPRATVLAADWPGRPLPIMPGDFSEYVPQGMGLGAPSVIRPWDDPLEGLTSPNYYGFEVRESDPIRGAPTQYAHGGVIYFDDSTDWAHTNTALMVMGVHLLERDFVVFERNSDDTLTERYLDQVRIMPRSALQHFFNPGPEAADIAEQPVTISEFIEQFLADQRNKWNAPPNTFSSRLAGTFGGDGDWAKEALCFGFLVENGYWGVYRLWSRAWLVTK